MLRFFISCTKPPSSIEITWFGVTTAVIETTESTILIDPYFSRPPFNTEDPTTKGHALYQEIMQAGQIDGLDAILVSHAHFDHIVDVGVAMFDDNTHVYGSKTTCLIAQAHSIPEDRCSIVNSLETFFINEINITPIRTAHWWADAPVGIGGSFMEYTEVPSLDNVALSPNGGMFSYLVETSQASLFIQPSMDAIDAQDGSGENFIQNFDLLFANRPPVDIWMMCGDCLEEQEEVEAYVQYLQPKNSIFMHWDASNPILHNHSLEEDLPSQFSPFLFYINALPESELWIPKQHFQSYTYSQESFQEAPSSLQKHFFPE